jgi:hypothetical protein
VIEAHDTLITYCPQLGGEVPFRYCRTLQEDLPCKKLMVCWEFRIEIAKFLSDHYSLDQVQQSLWPPEKSRIETIVELIEQAKKSKPR